MPHDERERGGEAEPGGAPPTPQLRPTADRDEPFLLELFASTRGQELAAFPFTDEQRAAFVGQQFAAHRHHVRTYVHELSDQVVLVDGAPVGRLVTAPVDGGLRIIDIALLPTFRGRGLGRALLLEVIAQAERLGVAASVHVEITNPAQRLYARLGFAPVGEHDGGSHRYLERPGGAQM